MNVSAVKGQSSMTESEGKKVLSLGGAKPKLELKKPADGGAAHAGSVRQSFSHGRSKTVAVEVKRKREGEQAPRGGSIEPQRGGKAPRQLTQEERDARVRALRGAVLEGNEVRRPQTPPMMPTPVVHNAPPPVEEPLPDSDTLRHRELEELRLIQEQEKTTAATKKKEDEQRRRELLEGRRSDDGRMRATRIGDLASPAAARPGVVTPRPATAEEEDDGRGRARRRRGAPEPAQRTRTNDRRRDSHLTI